jgi:hypothetical protein
MFKGTETIKRKIILILLTVVLLSFCTQGFAQQQDFIKEDNLGKFLNELMNIEVVTDIIKDISLLDMPAAITVPGRVDIQQPVQKTTPEIPWTAAAINFADIDPHKWAAATLGLYNPHSEKTDVQKVSIPPYSDKQQDLKGLKFEDIKMIEAILASEESLRGENTLMGLIWQVSENIDVAIVGQHLLDMTYPDLVDYTKNEGEMKRALYAKLTLRF